MKSLLLGVDGGNTKTIALVARSDGAIIGAGTAGCADIHNAGAPQHAIDQIVAACTSALAAAEVKPRDLAVATFSLAGADWPEDFELLHRELARALGSDVELEVVNDAIGALRAGTDDAVGVAVVCGTYGAVAARNAQGQSFHLGFWPDRTGAYALGSEALAAVWRAMLDLGPATALSARALARWGCPDPLELLHAFTRLDGMSELEPGRFADAVLDEAEAGDAVASQIVDAAGARLGAYARVCADRTGLRGAGFRLVLSGGVFRHPSTKLRQAILAQIPEADAVYPSVEPAVGAVLLAADRLGVRPDIEELRAGFLAQKDLLPVPTDAIPALSGRLVGEDG
jgi:N-acetylglucosamine kinase-like BadF-type ATPase